MDILLPGLFPSPGSSRPDPKPAEYGVRCGCDAALCWCWCCCWCCWCCCCCCCCGDEGGGIWGRAKDGGGGGGGGGSCGGAAMFSNASFRDEAGAWLRGFTSVGVWRARAAERASARAIVAIRRLVC